MQHFSSREDNRKSVTLALPAHQTATNSFLDVNKKEERFTPLRTVVDPRLTKVKYNFVTLVRLPVSIREVCLR